ncbi:hypothetical protein [Azospirillum thermophilum]|uniref:Uncharacterized protein n=1 Tax=Azospirillum thermophilum TaxID=2202148 RepID=A0A2S2CW29_9PROT|nr:hypothetical protein [Azospirillum thermophilum]AWK88733.1 hypothetical protein DEW08_21850 [Azospirillum thermophilum]
MIVVWSITIIVFLLIGSIVGGRLRSRYRHQRERLRTLNERLEVYRNYNKLAVVRREEAHEMLGKLRRQLAEEEEDLRRLAAQPKEPDPEAAISYHVFDRIAGRRGTVWHVAVEASEKAAAWTGVRHYAVTGETAEEARKRVQDRHPAMSGFTVGKAVPLDLAAETPAAKPG